MIFSFPASLLPKSLLLSSFVTLAPFLKIRNKIFNIFSGCRTHNISHIHALLFYSEGETYNGLITVLEEWFG